MINKLDIHKLDNEFAIVQKATSLKIQDAKEKLNNDSDQNLVDEVAKLLKIPNLKYNGSTKLLEEVEYCINNDNNLIINSDFSSWNEIIIESKNYSVNRNINIEELNTFSSLTPAELLKIRKELYEPFENLSWDEWDYAFVGIAGILAALTDYFLLKFLMI